jgi:RNA polymerase sigma-70 factor (ECF subfamily)
MPAPPQCPPSTLDEVIDAACAAWPGVVVPRADFATFLREKLIDPTDADALRGLHAADLYLAFACSRGDRKAIAAFDERLDAEVDRALRRLRAPTSIVDEVKGALREQLLVADGDGPPRVADFAGRGELDGWLRVSATRAALRMMKRSSRETGDDDLEAILTPAESPELAHMKRLYRGELLQALATATARLDVRQRNLLRYHYLDGLSIDEIGAIHGVHRATAARWLARARDELIAATRRELEARLAITPDDLESILRLIASQVDLSLRIYLKSHR